MLIDRALDEGLVSVLARSVRKGTHPAGHRPAQRAPPFIGEGRAREMAVNVVAPLHVRLGRDRARP